MKSLDLPVTHWAGPLRTCRVAPRASVASARLPVPRKLACVSSHLCQVCLQGLWMTGYGRTAAMTILDDFRRENKILPGVRKLACVSEPFCQGPLMCTAAARIVSVPLYIRFESGKELTGPEKLAGVFRAALPGAPGSTLLQRISLL